MIPKIIHYIWFGPKPFPKIVEKCISSWHKYLGDYEFKFWNESTFDIQNSCDFVREAYNAKKYAFVSDYVRVWALYNYGGIYLDTDIEIVKPFPKYILENKVVLGTDDTGHLTALMMSARGAEFFKKCLDFYQNQKFLLENGKMNMEVNNTHLQNILKLYGYKVGNNIQNLESGIILYPDDYFHCRSQVSGKLNITTNTYAIHWHTITWVPMHTRIISFIRIKIFVPLLGYTAYRTLAKIIKKDKTYI